MRNCEAEDCFFRPPRRNSISTDPLIGSRKKLTFEQILAIFQFVHAKPTFSETESISLITLQKLNCNVLFSTEFWSFLSPNRETVQLEIPEQTSKQQISKNWRLFKSLYFLSLYLWTLVTFVHPFASLNQSQSFIIVANYIFLTWSVLFYNMGVFL